MKRIKFFASILLMLCLSVVCCAQTKIDWKQIKSIPDTLEFKNVLLEHLLFKSAYQPVMESIHQGAIYYDNMTERMKIYENGQWRDLSVTIASDSIGAPLTILGYLQANDIYATQSAYIGKDVNVKGNVNASGTSTFNYLKVNNALKVPTVTNTSLGVGSIYYDTSANKLKVLNSSNQWKVVSVDVDSALSTTSTNPVQNKAITAKINQTDANLINGMATTLQQSYNYANGIATQAYNYADSAATDAETASKNYANTQIGILRSYVSQQLGSGTSDLKVHSIITTNASATHLAASYASATFLDINSGLKLPRLNPISSSAKDGAICFDEVDGKKLKYYRSGGWKTVATEDNTVSNVATGTNNTIAVTKNGVTTNIAVGGEGNMPSSLHPPFSNPTLGQMYFDTDDEIIRYWDGTKWRSIQTCHVTRVADADAHYWGSVIDIGTGVQRVSIQCGRSYTETDIYFSEAFKSGTTPVIALGDTSGPFNYHVSSVTNSSFRIERTSYESTTSPGATIFWIAIGQVDDN